MRFLQRHRMAELARLHSVPSLLLRVLASFVRLRPFTGPLTRDASPLSPRGRHVPRRVVELHRLEVEAGSFNEKLAARLSDGVSSMWCAYAFALLALLGFPGFHATPTQYVQWVSQTFIQLVMLSVLALVAKIQGRKGELQAEEQYRFMQQMYSDMEALRKLVEAQGGTPPPPPPPPVASASAPSRRRSRAVTAPTSTATPDQAT